MFISDTTVTVSPSFNSIVVAFGISVGIGVLFGYLPARRAARLNPIEALRYDCSATEPLQTKKGELPMKKRFLALSAGGDAWRCPCWRMPAAALGSASNTAVQTAITLGGMDAGQTGSLDAAVTRGAFATHAGGVLGVPGERSLPGGCGHPV